MQGSTPTIESRGRFLAKVAATYFVYAVISAALVWYELHHNVAIGWVIGGIVLIFLIGACTWTWSMRVYLRRYRAQSRAFYAQLQAERLRTHINAPEATAARHPSSHETVAVTFGMYTVPETIELTLMSMYWTPRNALVFFIFSLLILYTVLRDPWPPSMWRLLLAFAVAAAFNGLMVASVTTGMRRTLKRLWKGKSEAAIALSSRGLEISQDGQSGSLLPWTSIDQVRETGSWIPFIRDKRRIVALPKSRVPRESLGQLMEILTTAKSQLGHRQNQ